MRTCKGNLISNSNMIMEMDASYQPYIAKVLANRLREVIKELDRFFHLAFILGSQLLDGPVVASDIVVPMEKEG